MREKPAPFSVCATSHKVEFYILAQNFYRSFFNCSGSGNNPKTCINKHKSRMFLKLKEPVQNSAFASFRTEREKKQLILMNRNDKQ